MLERSHRRDDEGTEEETGTIIPSQKARKCMKEAAEEMARVQKRKLERLYPRRSARNKLERYTLTGGGWWEYGKSVEEHKNNGKCCFEGVPSKRLFGEMW